MRKANVLVVANRTAASPELLAALGERAQNGAARFELLVPPTVAGARGREAAHRNLDEALARLGEAGLECEGSVGTDPDVVVAVLEAYDCKRHDEIVVSTLPETLSHWLQANGPARIARATDAVVHHVVAHEPRVVTHRPPRARPEPPGLLAPFVALGYGGRKRA